VRWRTIYVLAILVGVVFGVAERFGGDWALIALFGGLSLAIIVAGFGPIPDEMLDGWSLRYDVAIDHPRREWIRARLRRARRARWVSFGLGTVVASAPMYANVIAPERAGDVSQALQGTNAPWIAAALGSLISELVVVQRPGGDRVAVLERRRWGDYVGDHWRRLLIGSSAVAVAAAAAVFLDGSRHRFTDPRIAGMGAAWSVVALVLAFVGMRAIVDRPLLDVEGMDRQLDEALRADGAHHLVGAAVAMSVFGASAAVVELFPVPNPLGFLAGFGMWFGVACWWFLARQETWNVARVRWRRA
jgi:hypothetical protein